MKYYHLIAHAVGSLRPLIQRDPCAALWAELKTRFPRAGAAILMPNHLHLLLASINPAHDHHLFCVALRAFSRKFFLGQKLWQPIPAPEEVLSGQKLALTLRYIHLNPCRAGIVKDPLAWEWSTHRDWLQLVANPWPDAPYWVKSLGWAGVPAGKITRFVHDFVSKDPSTQPQGTPLPQLSPGIWVPPLSKVELAIQRYLRLNESQGGARIQLRKLAVPFATQQLKIPQAALIEQWKLSSASITRLRNTELDPASVQTLRMYLEDKRLQ